MKLKQLMAGATIAGALGAAALGVGAGAASAAPGPQPGGHGAPAVSHAGPAPQEPGGGGATDLAGPVGQAAQLAPDPADRAATDPADPADPVDRVTTDLAGPADPVDRVTTDPAGPVARADPVTTDPADPVARVTTDPADPVDPAVHGPGGPGGPGGPWHGDDHRGYFHGAPWGRRTRTLGCWRATATGMGQAASAARWTVELRADQLLGLPGNAFLEPAVQPVRLRLLRSLDPAVKTHLTRRPLRRLAERALPVYRPINCIQFAMI